MLNTFYVSDFSAIEARVLAWLAGEEDILSAFREGRDVYCESASQAFGRTVTPKDKYERSVGKVRELASGYQGGIGAMATMSKAYGVDLAPAFDLLWGEADADTRKSAVSSYETYLKRLIPFPRKENPEAYDDHFEGMLLVARKGLGEPLPPGVLYWAAGVSADILKQLWRRKNKNIVSFWEECETAAINAVLTGEKQFVGGEAKGRPLITYGTYGKFLLCKSPSGNCISYPMAKVSATETPWGIKDATLSYHTQDDKTWQFGRKFTYGGKLVENITQFVARDCLADAMLRVDDAGFDLVLHVHDEVVVDANPSKDSFTQFHDIMSTAPHWAVGLPFKAESWHGQRYRK